MPVQTNVAKFSGAQNEANVYFDLNDRDAVGAAIFPKQLTFDPSWIHQQFAVLILRCMVLQ
jgi:hypothetical protein